MEWDDLRIFLAAVRAGSYSAAAPRLGINRTTVGRRVTVLEESLGVSIFRYNMAGPVPTPEGQLVLDAAARIENEIAALVAAIDRERASPMTIRVAGSAGIQSEFLEDMAAFARLNPQSRIELIGAIDPIDALTQRKADLAIVLERTIPRRVAGIQVGTVSQAVYRRRGCSADRPLGWGEDIELALPRHWTAANPMDPDSTVASFNSWMPLKQAVLAGMGKASLWCFAADADPGLERLEKPYPRFDTGLWLLHRTATPQSSDQIALADFLAERIRARLEAAA